MKTFGIAILLLVSGLAYGQMNPQYSSYTSWTTDGTRIYQTVLVDGQTTGGCYYTYACNCGTYGQGCQQCTGTYPGCVGATHTPKINNVLDGIGGWSTGPSQAPFTYMSYQTTVSAPVPAGIFVSSQTEGDVICSALGAILAVLSTTDIGHAPACGADSATVTIFHPPQVAKCDASTVNQARITVSGSAYSYVKSVTAQTTTDNELLLNLLGKPPFHDSYCSTSSSSCWTQNYKAAVPNQYTGKQGNILWSVQVFCTAGTQIPSIQGEGMEQSITCP